MQHGIRLYIGILLVMLAGPAPGAAGSAHDDRAEKAATTLRIERVVVRPGGVSESASFRVMGAAGQADAGVSSGPTYRIEGGFWFVDDDSPPLEEAIFNDGFES